MREREKREKRRRCFRRSSSSFFCQRESHRFCFFPLLFFTRFLLFSFPPPLSSFVSCSNLSFSFFVFVLGKRKHFQCKRGRTAAGNASKARSTRKKKKLFSKLHHRRRAPSLAASRRGARGWLARPGSRSSPPFPIFSDLFRPRGSPREEKVERRALRPRKSGGGGRRGDRPSRGTSRAGDGAGRGAAPKWLFERLISQSWDSRLPVSMIAFFFLHRHGIQKSEFFFCFISFFFPTP